MSIFFGFVCSPFPKLKEFADDNFKFDENGAKFPYRIETKTSGKHLQTTISDLMKMAETSPEGVLGQDNS